MINILDKFKWKCLIALTLILTGYSSGRIPNKNGNIAKNSLPLSAIVHKMKANWKEARRHATPRGASDIILIRNVLDGTLRATPLLVHFGSGLFPNKMLRDSPLKRVEMIVDGRRIRGANFRMGPNGVMEPRELDQNKWHRILLIRKNDQKRERRRTTHNVQFVVKDWKQRSVVVACSLYQWDSTAKLVISDIDGTVTKSDLWGMVLEKGWIQPDVRELYRRIKENGYRLIYLSARPAATGTLTKKFMNRLKLPSGPLLLSPEPLVKALKTALTDPERVKVRGMERLKELFNGESLIHNNNKNNRPGPNPFHAAFGNQETDQFAYEMVKIPMTFMVNENGKMTINMAGQRGKPKQQMVGMKESAKSYRYLIEHLDEYFPPIRQTWGKTDLIAWNRGH